MSVSGYSVIIYNVPSPDVYEAILEAAFDAKPLFPPQVIQITVEVLADLSSSDTVEEAVEAVVENLEVEIEVLEVELEDELDAVANAVQADFDFLNGLFERKRSDDAKQN